MELMCMHLRVEGAELPDRRATLHTGSNEGETGPASTSHALLSVSGPEGRHEFNIGSIVP